MVQLIMIILSQTALTVCQDVFPMAPIVEPICPCFKKYQKLRYILHVYSMLIGSIYKIYYLRLVSSDVIQPEPARAISHPRTQNEGPIFSV